MVSRENEVVGISVMKFGGECVFRVVYIVGLVDIVIGGFVDGVVDRFGGKFGVVNGLDS